VVRAAQSEATLQAATRRSWTRIAAAALLALLVATGTAIALSNRLLRPLRDLHALAKGIGTTDIPRVTASGLSELDAIAEALELSAQRVDDSMTRERAFSADVSHQLRTPITGLRLTLENELEHPRPDRGAAIVDALREIDQLETTVEGLLLLARDTMGRRTAIDCWPAIHQRTTAARRLLMAQGRALRFDHPGPVLVCASRQATAEILDVLLGNALQHASGTVTVAIEHHNDMESITVTDEGPGITNPANIFRRRDADAKGTGIGLALGRRLAEAEGGHLILGHHEGFCRFELLLPTGS